VESRIAAGWLERLALRAEIAQLAVRLACGAASR
jgi:hypothetical protein